MKEQKRKVYMSPMAEISDSGADDVISTSGFHGVDHVIPIKEVTTTDIYELN